MSLRGNQNIIEMKKIILYVTILSCCVFTSCETDDTAGVSDVTNYAVFDLSGPSEVLLTIRERIILSPVLLQLRQVSRWM